MLEQLESRRLLSADFVIDWNNVTIDVLRADETLPGPGWASRTFAMVHAATFDAVNGIDGTYRSLIAHGPAPRGASMDAAIAQAAHDVLVALYPQQRAFIDAELNDSLAQVPNGPAEIKGVQHGQRVAAAVLRARADDHSSDIVEHTVNPAPGHWEPDPANPTQTAWGPGWGFVSPFMMFKGNQFLPPRPPEITSAEYTAAFNEVKALGGDGIITPTIRTPEQTEIGIFWGYDRAGMGAPMSLYNRIVQVVAQQEQNTVLENARLFALVNLAQADAGIASWDCKYKDDYWRPISGIRRAGEDGNPDTVADPTWTPLGAPGNGTTIPNFTPPFPAYVSGHATFGAATFEVLRQFYGTDNITFTVGSDELPGVMRTFTSFSQAAEENARSRIYLGVHWNFDDTEGRALGVKVGDWVMDHALELNPRPPHHLVAERIDDGVLFSTQSIGTTRQLIDDAPADRNEALVPV